MVRMADLRERDVINVNDGKKLGTVHDLELDVGNGMISALIVPLPGGFMGVLGRKHELVIPWDRVIKLGIDTILVDYPLEPVED